MPLRGGILVTQKTSAHPLAMAARNKHWWVAKIQGTIFAHDRDWPCWVCWGKCQYFIKVGIAVIFFKKIIAINLFEALKLSWRKCLVFFAKLVSQTVNYVGGLNRFTYFYLQYNPSRF
jgi:hypothetical protein